MSETLKLELPKEKRKPIDINPNIMIIYSTPKAGKTTICAQLEDSLVLELEPNGANFVEVKVLEINTPREFDNALDLIEKSETKVCTYLIVDTVTQLDIWSEIKGTYQFMQKPQGKKWNREGDVPGGKAILHTDVRFESVHDLGQGHGYAHSRNVMTDWYDRLNTLVNLGKVDHVIMLCHIKDKMIETSKGEVVEVSTLNLTGKVKSIYCSKADAVANFYRKGKQGFLNFDNEHKVISGGRCSHLNKEILISEKQEDDSIKTYWDKVFIK